MQNRNTIFTTILLVLGCFGLLPNAQAVSPAPDGGYAGGNTAEGQAALLSLTTGGFNTAVGFFSLRSDTTNGFNTAIGAGALLANTADQNTATGAGALLSNTIGDSNTANGTFALFSNTTGSFNTANGYQALNRNTTGDNNTAIGVQALSNNTTGRSNVGLGVNAGLNVTTANNVICIGTQGSNVSDSCYIGNIFNATSSGGIPVLINSDGKLGTISSSRRFKKEIKTMDQVSEAILAFKPVTFHYKSDANGTPQFGLIAEEVAEVNPDLVVRDENGEIYTVRYDAVNAMLLNEFLKEHRKVEEQHAKIEKQQATIAELKLAVSQQQKSFAQQQAQIEALTSSLRNVSAQIEMSKPTTRVVANEP